ncbi:GntR family transcriptional regulator [Brevibacillus choshinensis]|uniref:GntR family transcriptional regulator n=1 Tax=Brevibacillus choshinensis TaxID=54911 RepID=A0ABX7FKL7_BRECH|nr:GntR family transcriptional regulator [Brevibacillus choshinensis]QRG66375.1 GntR family transcriptional regulator [Brevibacillus choshinensis]
MDFTPVLDPNSTEPLYQQIYQQISRAIVSGAIPAGPRLPSIRQMVRASPPSQFLPRIIVGFGGMAEADIDEGIQVLARAWYGLPSFASLQDGCRDVRDQAQDGD